ncbi:MAG: MFS transporter [Gammaproteobacteria bacterium]|nr:MFS transporter [Gammaproteobacteria bacterium]
MSYVAAPAFSATRFEIVRWSVFAVLVVAYMSVYFHRMAPGVVAGELMASFQTTGAALGSLAAMYYYVYTAMQVPAGVLADTVGIRAVAALGNVVAGVGSILFGLAESFEMASAGRFLVGLGVSVIFVGLMKSNTVWFSERRYGLVSGLTLFLGNLGSVLAAGPLAFALTLWSWREVFVGLGVGSLLFGVLSLLVVRNRPEDAGFPSLRQMEGRAAHAARSGHWWQALKAVLGTRAVWPGFFVNFGMAGGLFAFVGLWIIPLLRDSFGLGRAEAAEYATLTLFAMAVSAITMGSLSDRLGRRKPVLLACALLYAGVLAWLLFMPWQPGSYAKALFVLLGFTGGGFLITYPSAKEVCPPAVSGMAISVVNTGLFLGAALMQPLFGAALDLGWDGTVSEGVRVYGFEDYRYGLGLMLGYALMACAAATRITETRGRNLTVAETKG